MYVEFCVLRLADYLVPTQHTFVTSSSRMKRAIITAIWKGKSSMEEQEGKWDRLERERLQIRPETLTQLELLTQVLRTDTVDEAIRTLLSTQTFALHTMNMVETLQHAWNMNDSLEVVTRLARQAMDQL